MYAVNHSPPIVRCRKGGLKWSRSTPVGEGFHVDFQPQDLAFLPDSLSDHVPVPEYVKHRLGSFPMAELTGFPACDDGLIPWL